MQEEYDYIIIGSGFGGSVSALRLSEKGYKVLVVEKGKWYKQKDFPKTNWNLKKWLWIPVLRLFGILKLTLFKHVSILSGVGVGGGSLVYANTLPVPDKAFFQSGSWASLADWDNELKPFYNIALEMLGAEKNPRLFDGDLALKELAKQMGRESKFDTPNVAVYFGKAGETVSDPYFKGKGPERTGCTFCGSCMTGCRVGAKNTLDKNYLYLAKQKGAQILVEKRVYDVKTIGKDDGSEGYEVFIKDSTSFLKRKSRVITKGIIFSGGVLGTVPLLMDLKRRSLKGISHLVGKNIRMNNETLLTVTSNSDQKDYSKGVAIGSILQTDKNSHLEMVRYGEGSGFWKMSHVPHVTGRSYLNRFIKMLVEFFGSPLGYFRAYWNGDWSRRTSILLFMQTLDSTLGLKRNWLGQINTHLDDGIKPTADIPESSELTNKYASITKGKPMAFFQQSLLGKASTAHILGGAVMGKTKRDGVIDKNNKVFGYKNMLVVDGSMVSANPGVNPSLTITAIAERSMSNIPDKGRIN
jgi:cholesterol oxidase